MSSRTQSKTRTFKNWVFKIKTKTLQFSSKTLKFQNAERVY